MSARRLLLRLVLLALICMGGIVGMLLVDGFWDAAFLVMAALPLLVGGWRAWHFRPKSETTGQGA